MTCYSFTWRTFIGLVGLIWAIILPVAEEGFRDTGSIKTCELVGRTVFRLAVDFVTTVLAVLLRVATVRFWFALPRCVALETVGRTDVLRYTSKVIIHLKFKVALFIERRQMYWKIHIPEL